MSSSPTLTVRLKNGAALTAALRKYARLSKSEIPDIINRKAFYIARRACRETKRVPASEIRKIAQPTIFGTGTKYSRTRTGKLISRKFTIRNSLSTSLAAKILIARAVRAHKTIPTAADLVGGVKTFIAARIRSRAYLASGWLPAIRRLAQVVKQKGGPSMGPRTETLGREKGSAKPATEGFRVRAIIENATGFPGKFSKTQPEALSKFGEPALERAVAAEVSGTLAEIARRLKAAGQRAGFRFT